MANPAIIQCSCIYIFTTPLPPGSFNDLNPTAFVPSADIIPGYVGNTSSYFMLLLSDSMSGGEEKVQQALQYVWGQLVNRGVATGEMPIPVEGNPLDMLKS